MTFWGHGYRPRALPGETEAGEEGTGLGETAADAGELIDAFGGLGGGANRLLGERLFDDVGVGGEFAGRPGSDFTTLQAVETAVAKGDEVSLGGGDAQSGKFGGLFAGVAEMNGPQDVHLAADYRIRMVITIGQHTGLFVGGEVRSEPGCHPWHSKKVSDWALLVVELIPTCEKRSITVGRSIYERGKENGLASYLQEVRNYLAPLIGHLPRS